MVKSVAGLPGGSLTFPPRMKFPFCFFALLVLSGFLFNSSAWSQSGGDRELVVITADMDVSELQTRTGSVEVTEESGQAVLRFDFTPSEKFSNLRFEAPDGTWDLSAYRAIEVTVTNLGEQLRKVGCRLENPMEKLSEKKWVHGGSEVEPGATAVITMSLRGGYDKASHKLDPAAVSAILLFVNEPETAGALLIRSVRAVDPL